jgi:hypothetical protein
LRYMKIAAWGNATTPRQKVLRVAVAVVLGVGGGVWLSTLPGKYHDDAATPAPRTAALPELVVTRDQYGVEWPWPKFERGFIRCDNDQVTIQFISDDTIYGVNGPARSRRGYPDPSMYMPREPGTENISADGRGIIRSGAARGVGKLIQLGLGLCAQQGR